MSEPSFRPAWTRVVIGSLGLAAVLSMVLLGQGFMPTRPPGSLAAPVAPPALSIHAP